VLLRQSIKLERDSHRQANACVLGRPQDRRNDHIWSAGPDSRNRWNTGRSLCNHPDIRHHLCVKGEENPWIEIAPGIKRRTVCAGASMYQMRAELAAGSRLPEHAHRQEQIAHVIKGRMKLIVSGVPHELAAGDAFYLASNVPHGVETLEATTVIDTFSPPRDDYLALDNEARRAGK
jgi:quercetin dioxygenase-like cupin family protein